MAMIRQPENFPETVKEVRRQMALSQEELAHALGVSFATVNRRENGKTVPSKRRSGSSSSFAYRIRSIRPQANLPINRDRIKLNEQEERK